MRLQWTDIRPDFGELTISYQGNQLSKSAGPPQYVADQYRIALRNESAVTPENIERFNALVRALETKKQKSIRVFSTAMLSYSLFTFFCPPKETISNNQVIKKILTDALEMHINRKVNPLKTEMVAEINTTISIVLMHWQKHAALLKTVFTNKRADIILPRLLNCDIVTRETRPPATSILRQ